MTKNNKKNITMQKTYGVAMIERPIDQGLTRAEAIDLFDMLHGVNGIPIEIQSEGSVAMGWINLTDAELLGYRYDDKSELYRFIQSILEDCTDETDFVFNSEGVGEVEIWISR